jgi:hypothetical protein
MARRRRIWPVLLAVGALVLAALPQLAFADDPAAQAAPPVAPQVAPDEIHVSSTRAVSGLARLARPRSCSARRVSVTVTGRRIYRVTFYLDGRKVRQVRALHRARITVAIATRHAAKRRPALRAKVEFVGPSRTRTRTLAARVKRC